VGEALSGELTALAGGSRVGDRMKDPKATVRYLGFQVLSDGSRRLEFSFENADASVHLISVQASYVLFCGPDHMTIQECPGICYETLRWRIAGGLEVIPASIELTAADVAQHRQYSKTLRRRPNP
jgi:hypothetical protein